MTTRRQAPTTRPTIVGPHNCPECKLEARIAELEAVIRDHVHTDAACGEEYERRGLRTRPRCLLWWDGTRRRLGQAQHALASLRGSHHCQPHYCDYGPNCASFDASLRPG